MVAALSVQALIDADVGAEGGEGSMAVLVGDGSVTGAAEVGVGDEPGTKAVSAVAGRVKAGRASDSVLDESVVRT